MGHYFNLTRDFISEQNVSGYETLKSRGLELIGNDSLRSRIISLYEYDYNALQNLEERYYEMQFQENYFDKINQYIAPALIFDEKGNITGLQTSLQLTQRDKQLFLSYLWKIRANRAFILNYYAEIKEKISQLQKIIELETG